MSSNDTNSINSTTANTDSANGTDHNDNTTY